MTVEQLKKVHQARPFRPFTLKLADGSRLRVRHPEMMSYSESGRTAVVHGEGNDFDIIDLLLVVGLEVRNGHAKRSKRK
ncbi:MAG: hypothetical protein DCC65_04125 [Planctomycetota bacterium]|nr:MAG: hypothetical protein DCC65_04125 [Planctomycetota bacterium]